MSIVFYQCEGGIRPPTEKTENHRISKYSNTSFSDGVKYLHFI